MGGGVKMGKKKSRFSAKILTDSYSEASPEYKYGVIDPIGYVGGGDRSTSHVQDVCTT